MTDLIDWKTATTGELIRNACWVKGMEGVLPANDAGHEIKHRLDAYYELAAKPDLGSLHELVAVIRQSEDSRGQWIATELIAILDSMENANG